MSRFAGPYPNQVDLLQVKQLARLSLRDPQYVSVHENAEAPTPAKLEQVQQFWQPAATSKSGGCLVLHG